MSRKKAVLFGLAAAILAVIFLFAAGEIAFRFFKPAKQAIPMGKPDAVFHHLNEPILNGIEHFAGFPTRFSINSAGFRGKEISLSKPSGVCRIAIFGDSFTFGTGVNQPETFSCLLEEALNNEAQAQKYEVINCGIASYSPILEYLLLKYKVINYSPDLVILFYDFSDLQEDSLRKENAIFDKSGELIACNPSYINGRFGIIQYLNTHSSLFSYLNEKTSKSFKKMRLLGLKEYLLCHLQGKSAADIIKKKGSLMNAEFDRYFIFRENKDKGIIRNYWKDSEVWLDKIREFLDKRGVDFILVAYPYGLQVSPAAWQAGRAARGFEKNKLYDSPVPFEMFYEYCARQETNFINLWPYLLKYGNEELYYDWDGHWTALGHKRVSEGIINDSIFKGILAKKKIK